MTKSKSTKKALLVSVFALVICFAMLVGSTFAWFTDSASTAVNTIQSGTLSIELQDDEGNSLEGRPLNFVKAPGAPAGEEILWEPGCTYQLEPVNIVNTGKLALKYKIILNGVDGDTGLLKVIDWTVLVNGTEQDIDTFEGTLIPGESTSAALTIKGHMQETAGNEYQDQAITGVGITVLATQYTHEYDSSRNDYDAEAAYPVSVWDGSVTTDWYVEESSEFTLTSADQFAGLAELVNGGTDFSGKTVTLGTNIDLAGKEWTPIGDVTRSGSNIVGPAFNGTFDGGNAIVSHLSTGLFGGVTGTVKNVAVADSTINSNADQTGFIAAMLKGGTIENCTTSATCSVTAPDGAGGIVGRVLAEGTVANCTNNASVSGDETAGGIVGKAYYSEAGKTMVISGCTNNGAVTTSVIAGGIAGFSAAEITDCTNTAAVSGNTQAGGIAGEQTNCGKIENCTNTAEISANVTTVGGIVGWVRYQNNPSAYAKNEMIVIRGNTNSGNVNAPASSLGAGGIVGTVYDQASVTGNTNTCASVTGGTFAAGIAGNLQKSSGLSIDGCTITVSGNTYSAATVITGGLTNDVAYNNNQTEFVVENNIAG